QDAAVVERHAGADDIDAAIRLAERAGIGDRAGAGILRDRVVRLRVEQTSALNAEQTAGIVEDRAAAPRRGSGDEDLETVLHRLRCGAADVEHLSRRN